MRSVTSLRKKKDGEGHIQLDGITIQEYAKLSEYSIGNCSMCSIVLTQLGHQSVAPGAHISCGSESLKSSRLAGRTSGR